MVCLGLQECLLSAITARTAARAVCAGHSLSEVRTGKSTRCPLQSWELWGTAEEEGAEPSPPALRLDSDS